MDVVNTQHLDGVEGFKCDPNYPETLVKSSDDPPAEETWFDRQWGYFNRYAEECARWARAFGLL